MKFEFSLDLPLMIYRAAITSCFILSFILFITPVVAAESKYDYDIQQVAESEISNCTFLADVQGSSSYGKTRVTAWKEKGKHKALEQAVDLNATHVVWNNGSTGYGSGPRISGSAYYCDNVKRLADTTRPRGSE
ncbi:hypothetical protein SAMN05216419_101621 [Nitrosomonas cryotolerans]|uniref:DUF4156 domain-containing protein n=1 Tax=Nitrosomonas cryotolerans ATCC 49181 TaxID=1131553 RepID=A0A1N6HD21_9PROT|nr:hypothetical protein [Nitrosomonas cryotolerans]SFP73557.1 hypothetical protein SAMN05216419_101621 [Nitrosomonas cryotolerans]SIO17724.1 hypothetical protein SAMN02743940_1131 [Nitrosomonas cryotolerans ATCC 49181]